jgi:CRP/FNR family transcriptional regulator
MFPAKNLESTNSNRFVAALQNDSPLASLRELDHLRVSKCYPRGAVLFIEGQSARGVYILRAGRVKVSIASAEGKKLVLRISQPGDLLGMNATLTGQPYSATAETLERCRIDFIPRQDLLQLLERDQKVYAAVARALCSKLNSVVEHARLLFLAQSTSEKLARLLMKWCDEHGEQTADGIRIDSGLTHEEMAQMICTSRETVTRLLGDFRRRNVVSLIDNIMFVRNRNELEVLAHV